MTEILCVVCQKRRPQWPLCCEGCRKRMREQLAELVKQYALLDAEPGTNAGPKVSGTRTAPLPVRLDVLNLVGAGSRRVTDTGPDAAEYQIGETPPLLFLEQWVIDWIEVRQQREHRPPCTVVDLVAWLTHRLDEACDDHPAIDSFAAELQEQIQTLRRVNGQRSDWRHIGDCPERDEDGRVCGTRLYANPWVDIVTCKGCGTRWDRREWRFLGAVLRDIMDTGIEEEDRGAA